MIRARGQSSRKALDREYPHQVLVLSNEVPGATFNKVVAFHHQIRAPMKSRPIVKDDEWYSLYCFANKQDALAFQLTFGGEIAGG